LWGNGGLLTQVLLRDDGGFDVAGAVHEAADDPVELGEGAGLVMASLERNFPCRFGSETVLRS
jgi:hypothetical protein